MAKELKMKSIHAATVMFEAEHKECVRVLPYTKDGQMLVHFYVYNDEYKIPKDLKEEAQKYFNSMNVELEWSDLYNNSVNVLKVQHLEYSLSKPKALTASQVEEMNNVIERNLSVLLKHRNVTSVQASFKIKNSKQTDEPCITIYVLGKGFIPFGESVFPTAFEGYPVDVMNGFWMRAGRYVRCPEAAQEQSDVLCFGASIGVQGKEIQGTLGAIVKNGSTFYALSCDHVMNWEESRRIIHPGLLDHLNCLKYYLGQYKCAVNDLTGLETQWSVETLTSNEELLSKFEELKSIKENHRGGYANRYNRKIIEKTEGIFEGKVEPRVIGEYIDGVSGNVKWTDGKEYYVDAAIAVLFTEEVESLKESRWARMFGTHIKPGSECCSANHQALLSAHKLCKSGRTTGYTEINSELFGSIEAPFYLKPPLCELQTPFLACLSKKYSCKNCGGSQEDLVVEKPRRCKECDQIEARLCEKLWFKR